MLGEGGRARRHRGAARAQLDEGALESVEQQLDVEEPANLLLGEDEQGYPLISEKRITVTTSSWATSRL